jgi:hypothetical protein
MVDQVAGLIGGKTNPNTRDKAIQALDRAADRLNSFGIFLYRLKEETYDSLTADQQTLDKPSDWGWPTHTAGAYDSDGDIVARITWVQWDEYRGMVSGDDTLGTPVYLSLRGLEDGIYLWPYVDTDEVASIRIPYYARVQRPSEASEIALLPETREALIAGGEFLVMKARYAKLPNVWQPYRMDFERAATAALGASKRWLTAAYQAAYPELAGSLPSIATPMNPGTVYIKVN